MTPLRSQIYEQLESGTTYSIEALAHKYRTNEHVIKVQLDRLKQEGKKIKVTDEEVSIFLNHDSKFWLFASYIFMGFILAVLFGGWIHG
ncbi:hypothetical protein [Cytobacillus oceanisediminis]|uniref:hypothetical protein n=1 Tax=Cytobacillus oceanisediminis TaxID=665099 RepID=UPI0037354229